MLGLDQIFVGTSNESSRHKWIENKLVKISNGARILDPGAGEQKFKPYCSHLNYVSQEFAQYDPSHYDSGLQMSKWDYTGLDIVSDIVNIPEQLLCFGLQILARKK